MAFRINKLASLLACGFLAQAAFVPSVLADERITDDYIALVFEAEDDDTRGDRWILMNSSTPEQDNDPDGNHSDGAVGGAYIELLPDMRVTHDDEFGPPTAIWNQPGTGPKAEYTMNFPEAGRYYVHLRAYSTGTEDNGIHVGINNTWPDSGARLQFCTAGSGWQWSAKQRDSGGVGPCGAQKTIWVTVPDAGVHTFMISAREDGFEADRIMLIKDLSDNTRICKPSGADGINCVNGSLENVDEVVDLGMTAEVSETEVNLDGSVVLSVIARNHDGYDKAYDAQVIVGEGIGTQWNASGLQDGCSIGGGEITCNMGTVSPSHPGEEGDRPFEFILEPLQSGQLDIPVSVKTSSVDDNVNNDATTLSVNVLDDGNSLSSMSVQFANTGMAWQEEVETDVTIVAGNGGPGAADNATVNLNLPSELAVSDMPNQCSGVTNIQCNLGSLAVNAQTSLNFGITPNAAGMLSISASADASNQNGGSTNTSMIADVEAAPVVVDNTDTGTDETTEPETDTTTGDNTGTGVGTDTGAGTDTGTDGETTTDSSTETDGGSVTDSETGSNTETGVDTVVTEVTDSDVAEEVETTVEKKSGLGATVWWALLVLSLILSMRQMHLVRLNGRNRLAVARHIS